MIRRRTRRRISRRSALTTILIGIVVATVFLLTSTTFNDSGCIACHRPATTSVSHGAMSCAECHRASGLAGVLGLRLRVVSMLLGAPFGGAPPSVAVDSSRCLRCHSNVLTKTVSRRGVIMSHREPNDAGVACIECHGDGIHGGTRESAGRSEMSACLRCHVVSATSADCDTCHVPGVTRAQRLVGGTFTKTHGPSWQQLHGMGDLNTCSACHTLIRCESCHGVTLPHPDSWLSNHGRASLQAGSRCLRCHSESFCVECHQVDMPHPSGFRARHSTFATGHDDPRCLTCHSAQTCGDCHSQHLHPGLAADKVQGLRGRAGLGE